MTGIGLRDPGGVVAINSAIEVDLSGQVRADSMGFSIDSGIGGQMDFMRSAARIPDNDAPCGLTNTSSELIGIDIHPARRRDRAR